MTDWIPRKKRKKIFPVWVKAVAAMVLVAMIAIMGILFQNILFEVVQRKPDNSSIAPVFKATPEAIDSLFGRFRARCGIGGGALRSIGGTAAGRFEYVLEWPRNLPPIWLMKAFQSVCNETGGLVCIGIENKDGWVAELQIMAGAENIARITVEKGAAMKAGKIGFAIEKFAKIKRETIAELIKTGMAFGFFLKLGEFPDAALAKILQGSRGECILEVPTDTDNWDIILKTRNVKLPPRSLPDKKAIKSILEQVPKIKAISLISSGRQDRSLIRQIIAAAAELDLDYIYGNDAADFADSLAYSTGLRIFRRSDFIEAGDEISRIKSIIMERIGQVSLQEKGCFVLPGAVESISFLLLIKSDLDGLGLKTIPPSAFLKPTENL